MMPQLQRFLLVFQHTAARRRLHAMGIPLHYGINMFQHTAARRRLLISEGEIEGLADGFNTQPPEGGCLVKKNPSSAKVCFNTQPPEGGCLLTGNAIAQDGKFQHTAARRRLLMMPQLQRFLLVFQHTAARRRLHAMGIPLHYGINMFQHTAARRRLLISEGEIEGLADGFNTQPPEGGCLVKKNPSSAKVCFNTQPPEGGCPLVTTGRAETP